MTSHSREGDFNSILDEESLENAAEDLSSMQVLSDSDSIIDDDDDDDDLEPDSSEESRIKFLIRKGKEQGYLTHDQVTDALPEDITEADDVESIIQMFEEMGITVYEETPEREEGFDSDDGEEEIIVDAAALAAMDSVVGKTMDPVRMYMREMGTVPLLTREGEIEIAKRIEEGIRDTMAIMAHYPGIVEKILAEYDEIIAEDGDLGVIISGLLDPEDKIPDMSDVAEAKSSGNYEADDSEETKGPDPELAHQRFREIRKRYDKARKVIAKHGRNHDKAT
ncbi:MAG: hypothetical protein HUJ31_19550, partial [Pseudomonadales bacterium]|nr:hypothetical protein [Pseudomonadales bacterium]